MEPAPPGPPTAGSARLRLFGDKALQQPLRASYVCNTLTPWSPLCRFLNGNPRLSHSTLGVPVSIAKAIITRLAKEHSHSAGILKAFVPLLEAHNALAEALPAPVLPPLDHAAFSQGKAWLSAESANPALYFDEAFLKVAHKKLVSAAAKGFPERKEPIRALGSFLTKNKALAAELAGMGLKGQTKQIVAWAKKHEQDTMAASLLAAHLAAAAARRLERAAASTRLPAWGKGYCPLCGSRPHGSCLREKEGRRWLQCSLCRHEWVFSRTTCPVCEQDSPKELPLFFLESTKHERAEVCNICKHYILGVDMRELDGSVPLELFLLCMTPLDLLMQEKQFIPATAAR